MAIATFIEGNLQPTIVLSVAQNGGANSFEDLSVRFDTGLELTDQYFVGHAIHLNVVAL